LTHELTLTSSELELSRSIGGPKPQEDLMSPSADRFVLVFVLITSGACSSAEPPSRPGNRASKGAPDSGPSTASRVLADEVAVYTDLCRCPSALGQPDPQTCFLHYVARTPPEAECVKAVFETHAAELDGILECEIQVVATTRACLAGVANCEPSPVVGCAASGLAANAACGAYPDAVQRGIDECYGVGDAAAPSSSP
jgi:hypothetical protein